MSNVNTKMQTFYRKGYHDAIMDSTAFIDLVSKKFGHLKFKNDLTLDLFLATMLNDLNRSLNGSGNQQD
jgi:hypothetical protein